MRKKLEFEKTKSTQDSTFKTDIIKAGFVSNFLNNKISHGVRFSCRNLALVLATLRYQKNYKWINIQINTTSETFLTLNILGSMGLWNVTLTGENGGSYVTHSWLPSMHDNLDSETSEADGVGEQMSI